MAALVRPLRTTEAGVLVNDHAAAEGSAVFAHRCRSGPRAAWVKVRNPVSIAVQRERSENRIDNPLVVPATRGTCPRWTVASFVRSVFRS
jgi:hypothetical protein